MKDAKINILTLNIQRKISVNVIKNTDFSCKQNNRIFASLKQIWLGGEL